MGSFSSKINSIPMETCKKKQHILNINFSFAWLFGHHAISWSNTLIRDAGCILKNSLPTPHFLLRIWEYGVKHTQPTAKRTFVISKPYWIITDFSLFLVERIGEKQKRKRSGPRCDWPGWNGWWHHLKWLFPRDVRKGSRMMDRSYPWKGNP